MGTFEASRIRTAAQDYVCGNHLPGRGCGDVIKRGDRYLSYVGSAWQRGRMQICLNASGHESVMGCAYEREYDCAAMRAEIARSGAG